MLHGSTICWVNGKGLVCDLKHSPFCLPFSILLSFFCFISSTPSFVGFYFIRCISWRLFVYCVSFFHSSSRQWMFRCLFIYFPLSLSYFLSSLFLEWCCGNWMQRLQKRVRLYCSIQRVIQGNFSYFLAHFSFSLLKQSPAEVQNKFSLSLRCTFFIFPFFPFFLL